MAVNIQYKKIASLQGDFFPYTLGKISPGDWNVLGVMDLKDPLVESGQESDLIFHFFLTPEEAAWYPNEIDKLNDLAQILQLHMPKSRFACITSASGQDQSVLDEAYKHAVTEEYLENDTAYEQWRTERRKADEAARSQAQQRQQQAAARIAAMPKTPLNEARYALYTHQSKIAQFDRLINQQVQSVQTTLKQTNPDIAPAALNEAVESDATLRGLKEARQKEADLGQSYEEALGNRIFTSPEIYVAIDECWVKHYPLVDPAKANAFIFSTKEIADRFAEKMKTENRFYTTIQSISRDNIKNALRSWESMGIVSLVVDDGEMPVRVLTKNIIPAIERGFIESVNADVRNLLIRVLQITSLIQIHEKDIDVKWKETLQNIRKQLEPNMFTLMGRTAFFVPVRLPEKQIEQLKGDYIYTPESDQHITDLLKDTRKKNPPLARASFQGRHLIQQYQGLLPIAIISLQSSPQNPVAPRHFLPVYTSREEAIAATEKQPTMIFAISMDELKTHMEGMASMLAEKQIPGEFAGIMLDPHTIQQLLNPAMVDHILNVRNRVLEARKKQ